MELTAYWDLILNILKVIRYQKQLQLNYVQMYKRNKTLESEVNKIWSQKNADMEKSLTNIQTQDKNK